MNERVRAESRQEIVDMLVKREEAKLAKYAKYTDVKKVKVGWKKPLLGLACAMGGGLLLGAPAFILFDLGITGGLYTWIWNKYVTPKRGDTAARDQISPYIRGEKSLEEEIAQARADRNISEYKRLTKIYRKIVKQEKKYGCELLDRSIPEPPSGEIPREFVQAVQQELDNLVPNPEHRLEVTPEYIQAAIKEIEALPPSEVPADITPKFVAEVLHSMTEPIAERETTHEAMSAAKLNAFAKAIAKAEEPNKIEKMTEAIARISGHDAPEDIDRALAEGIAGAMTKTKGKTKAIAEAIAKTLGNEVPTEGDMQIATAIVAAMGREKNKNNPSAAKGKGKGKSGGTRPHRR